MEETIHFNENLQRSSKFEKGIKSLKDKYHLPSYLIWANFLKFADVDGRRWTRAISHAEDREVHASEF